MRRRDHLLLARLGTPAQANHPLSDFLSPQVALPHIPPLTNLKTGPRVGYEPYGCGAARESAVELGQTDKTSLLPGSCSPQPQPGAPIRHHVPQHIESEEAGEASPEHPPVLCE